MTSKKALKLYLSWAKASSDDKLAVQLKKHLAMLERRRLISVWGEVEAGMDLDKEETRRINQSDIILLLISVDFFNDKDCLEDLKLALDRHQQEDQNAFVIPVMLRTTYMESTVLTKLKMLPSEKYPVVHKHWENIDDAFLKVVNEIVRVVKYVNQKENVNSQEVVSNDKLEIQNPSLNEYKQAVEVMNVHSIPSAGDIGGIQNLGSSESQEKIIDDFLLKSDKLTSLIVDDLEFTKADLLLKKAILLHKSAIRHDDPKKLEEAFKLLGQANTLEPQNIEILLEMAKVLVVLTPDDTTDEEAVLEKIELMVQNPKDDDTAFYLAQARFMLATSSLEHIDTDLLKKAKKTFTKLGHKQMVSDCDEMIAYADQLKVSKIPNIPKVPGRPAPPPLPKPQAFNPVGEWEVEVHSFIPNTIFLSLFPNGSLNGKQMYMPFTGNWSYQNNYIYIMGFLSGFPFEFAVQIQQEQNGHFHGMGLDGNRYVFKRKNNSSPQTAFSSGMR